MGGYLVNFAIYTMSMLGLIFLALMIYQKTANNCGLGHKNNNFLGIEEAISMGARKTLYVVRAGEERFLIASDVDKTSFIAKLDHNAAIKTPSAPYSLDNKLSEAEKPLKQVNRKPVKIVKNSVDDLPVIVDFTKKKKTGNGVIQNMLNKINE